MSCLFRTKHDALSWAIESANAVDAEIEARRNDPPVRQIALVGLREESG
jgi:hypothetical protein